MIRNTDRLLRLQNHQESITHELIDLLWLHAREQRTGCVRHLARALPAVLRRKTQYQGGRSLSAWFLAEVKAGNDASLRILEAIGPELKDFPELIKALVEQVTQDAHQDHWNAACVLVQMGAGLSAFPEAEKLLREATSKGNRLASFALSGLSAVLAEDKAALRILAVEARAGNESAIKTLGRVGPVPGGFPEDVDNLVIGTLKHLWSEGSTSAAAALITLGPEVSLRAQALFPNVIADLIRETWQENSYAAATLGMLGSNLKNFPEAIDALVYLFQRGGWDAALALRQIGAGLLDYPHVIDMLVTEAEARRPYAALILGKMGKGLHHRPDAITALVRRIAQQDIEAAAALVESGLHLPEYETAVALLATEALHWNGTAIFALRRLGERASKFPEAVAVLLELIEAENLLATDVLGKLADAGLRIFQAEKTTTFLNNSELTQGQRPCEEMGAT